MKALGLDIGTTTISFVVTDEKCCLVKKATFEHKSDMAGVGYEKKQDPAKILDIVVGALRGIKSRYDDISCIGITGQMHGILYLDQNGCAVSPLYTWQDGRGDLTYEDGRTYAEYLSAATGYTLATGYGMVTHFYNIKNGLVPENAQVFCTIPDYIAMKLTGSSCPVTDRTNALSIGLFDIDSDGFDRTAVKRAGIDLGILPKISRERTIGFTEDKIPVYLPMGDNQASFIGAAHGKTDKAVINIGTGSQISIYTKDYIEIPALETRPYPGGGWLIVGASLCGGKSYALLEQFIRAAAYMVTGTEESAYGAMKKMMENSPEPENCPHFITTFLGTRRVPTEFGSISGLNTENFTPLHFIYGVMYGMAEELYALYEKILRAGYPIPDVIIGSGNGLRKNGNLRHTLEKVFGCRIVISEQDEEAAFGAAIYACTSSKDSEIVLEK